MTSPESTTPADSLAERYRVLLEIGRSISGTLDADELYSAIYRETRRVIDSDGFYISLYDAEADEATVVFWAERDRERRDSIRYRGSDSEVLRTGKGSIVDDGLRDRSLVLIGEDTAEEAVTRSAAAAPIRAGDLILGSISAQSYRAGAYSASDLELLTAIADIAAVAIQNARHVEELERRRREAERMETFVKALTRSLEPDHVLNEIVAAALHLLDADGAAVWLLEEGSARVSASGGAIGQPVGTRFPLEGELVQRLLESPEPVVLDDVQRSPLLPPVHKAAVQALSAMIVPLIGSKRVLGALSVGSRALRKYAPDDVHLLKRLSNHATSALENARLHATLQALSLTDPLTGLSNRRHLESHLSREYAAAARGRNLSIVLFDLDNFKIFNDRYGHIAGDEALRALGVLLAGETRAMNLVARFGGDEFLTVLSDTAEAGARLHAVRVAERIQENPELGGRGITVSFGVATFSGDGTSITEMIREADADMYRSKEDNRNPGR